MPAPFCPKEPPAGTVVTPLLDRPSAEQLFSHAQGLSAYSRCWRCHRSVLTLPARFELRIDRRTHAYSCGPLAAGELSRIIARHLPELSVDTVEVTD